MHTTLPAQPHKTPALKHIAGIIVLSGALAACNGLLDIKPENVLTEREVFATETLAEGALGDAYRHTFVATTGTAYAYGDLGSNAVPGSASLEALAYGNTQADDYYAQAFWADTYAAINVTNSLIEKIPVYGQYSESKKNQHVAEARFLRAFLYHQLLKLFAPGALQGDMTGHGVPLQLAAYNGYVEGNVIPRATVSQVYSQVLKDLDDAYPYLPEDYGDNQENRSRATKGTVDAFRARVYLGLHDYENAAAYAALVLDRTGVYALASNLLNVFPANPEGSQQSMDREYIFGYPVSGGNMGYHNIYYYFKYYLWADEGFVATYAAGDQRRDELIFQGYTDPSDPVRTARITSFKFNSNYQYDNVPIIRLPEVMLTRAEALAATDGVNQESVDLLNAVWLRANPGETGYSTEDFPSTEALQERIFSERRLELAFEGHYRYDLIRTGRPLTSPDIDADHYVLPIPQTEVIISGGIIKQNDGY